MKTLKLKFLLAFFALVSCSEGEDTLENLSPNIELLTAELIDLGTFEYEFKAVVSDDNPTSLTYQWDFGDGTSKTGSETELHTFEEGNSYTIKLTVSDSEFETIKVTSVSTLVIKISLDPQTTYQEIEGFGGFGAEKVWWSSPPFYTDSHVDKIINDLGVTILRDNIPGNFEPENDNDDPNVLDLSKFNITDDTPNADSHLGQHLPYLKAMADAGLDKMIASVWSPPLWMKHINHRGNGVNSSSDPGAYSAPPYTNTPDENTNQLKVGNYEEFAEYLVAYVKTIKAEVGIDVYAISIQNEPIFSQFYASCVYNADAYRDLLKVVGKRFKDEGLETKFFGQEDVAIFSRIEPFINTINADPEARDYLDIFAIHNYGGDGINPADEAPNNWTKSRQIADANGHQLWMSETSGFDDSWKGGFALAKSIYNALQFGNINAWVYWQMSDGSDGALIRNGTNTDKYYVAKHFYRYIRPGAVQIASNSDDANVLVLAYKHEANNTSTVLFINNSTTEQIIEMPDPSINYEVFQSDDSQSFADDKTVNNGRLVLPPQSVTTLFND